MRISDWSSDVCSSDLADAFIVAIKLAGDTAGVVDRRGSTDQIDLRIARALRGTTIDPRDLDRRLLRKDCRIVGLRTRHPGTLVERLRRRQADIWRQHLERAVATTGQRFERELRRDRKSPRLNSSH